MLYEPQVARRPKWEHWVRLNLEPLGATSIYWVPWFQRSYRPGPHKSLIRAWNPNDCFSNAMFHRKQKALDLDSFSCPQSPSHPLAVVRSNIPPPTWPWKAELGSFSLRFILHYHVRGYWWVRAGVGGKCYDTIVSPWCWALFTGIYPRYPSGTPACE